MTAVRTITVGVVALCFFAGCATTEARVRVLSRTGALRDRAIAPAQLTPGLRVAVGPEAATNDELALLEQQLAADLHARMASAVGVVTQGQLTVVKARVKASPGRERHRYLADCRLRLSIEGAVVAEAEAEVGRLVQARNLSVLELEQMRVEVERQGGRVPLLSSIEVQQVIVTACAVAFDAVAFGAQPEDQALDARAGAGFSAQQRSLARKDQRRRVIEKIEKSRTLTSAPASSRATNNLAAALVDLGVVGALDDAPLVAAHLYDANALVRRAAEDAFRALCAGQITLAPSSRACLRPAPPPSTVLPVAPDAHRNPETEGDHEDDDGGPVRSSEPPPPLTPAPATPPTTPTTPTTTTPTTTTTTPTTCADGAPLPCSASGGG